MKLQLFRNVCASCSPIFSRRADTLHWDPRSNTLALFKILVGLQDGQARACSVCFDICGQGTSYSSVMEFGVDPPSPHSDKSTDSIRFCLTWYGQETPSRCLPVAAIQANMGLLLYTTHVEEELSFVLQPHWPPGLWGMHPTVLWSHQNKLELAGNSYTPECTGMTAARQYDWQMGAEGLPWWNIQSLSWEKGSGMSAVVGPDRCYQKLLCVRV